MTLRYLGPLDPGTMDPWYGLVWFGLLGFISDNFFKKSLSFYRANIKLLYSQYIAVNLTDYFNILDDSC